MTSTVGQIRVAPMTQDEAEVIAGWRYEPPYDFYNTAADARDFAELLDPEQRGDRYFAARNAAGELIGYFEFGCEAGIVGVGLGLRPDLTGRGLGIAFLEQGLDFARKRFAPTGFKLSVAEFNTRAITVYERSGFVVARRFTHETNGSLFPFIEMERPA